MDSCRRFSLRRAAAIALSLCAQPALAAAQDVVVPVQFIDGLPVVTVTLGDLRADFLLDTGSSQALTIPRPLITPAAGVAERPESVRMTDAAGVVQEVRRLRAESVALGAAQLGPAEGLVHYRWGLSVGDGRAPAVTQKGAVGLGVFGQRGVLFELGRGRLTVFAAGARPQLPGPWFRAPFAYDKRGAVVEFMAHGQRAELALDSAATSSMLKKGSAVLSGPNDVCKNQQPDAPACGMTTFSAGVIGNAPPARSDFAVVAMGPLPFDGLLGIDFFKTHAVYLDLATHEMRFKPAP